MKKLLLVPPCWSRLATPAAAEHPPIMLKALPHSFQGGWCATGNFNPDDHWSSSTYRRASAATAATTLWFSGVAGYVEQLGGEFVTCRFVSIQQILPNSFHIEARCQGEEFPWHSETMQFELSGVVPMVQSSLAGDSMTNVVQFPARRLPPMPDVDALLAERTAVEIELARAQLARIRSETRQKRGSLVLVLLQEICSGASCCGRWSRWRRPPRPVDSSSFYNANGGYAGSSLRPGNGKFTNFYDRNGQYVGTEVRHGVTLLRRR